MTALGMKRYLNHLKLIRNRNFTIVWKNVEVAHADADISAVLRELYPDQERFEQEEQRRFELLLEHMDVPVEEANLAEW